MFAFKRFTPHLLAGAAVAGAAAVAAATLAASPASASPKAVAAPPAAAAVRHGWTISPGGWVLATASSGAVHDTSVGRTVDCHVSTMAIHLKGGTYTSGANVGLVDAATLTGCDTMHHLLPVRVSLGALPWHINLSHYNAATRVTTGYLSGLHLAIGVPLLGCTAVADGTGPDTHTGLLAASYSDTTHVLSAVAAGSHLRVYDVSHCDGLIKNGDSVVLAANYKISPGVKITHS